MTWDELREKFKDCARQSGRIGEKPAMQAFEAIRKLEQAHDIGKIVGLLH
jgi:hypothetical protein